MAKSNDELYKIIRELQKELDREKGKALKAQAHAYDLQNKDLPPTSNEKLKADNVYLYTELKRVIEQRDHFKQENERMLKEGGKKT